MERVRRTTITYGTAPTPKQRLTRKVSILGGILIPAWMDMGITIAAVISVGSDALIDGHVSGVTRWFVLPAFLYFYARYDIKETWNG